MTKGRETFQFQSDASDDKRIGGSADARILRNCLSVKAQKFPPRSFARTAIKVPEFGSHSHQLGSSPLVRRPNYSLYQGIFPDVKWERKSEGYRRVLKDAEVRMAGCTSLILTSVSFSTLQYPSVFDYFTSTEAPASKERWSSPPAPVRQRSALPCGSRLP